MSLQSSAQRAWSLLRQKAHGQRQATHSTSKPTNRNSTVVSFVQRFHSHKAAQRLLTTRSAHKNFVARTYTTESSDSESNKSGNDKKVIKLTSGPNGGQREPTSEELKEMLRESGTSLPNLQPFRLSFVCRWNSQFASPLPPTNLASHFFNSHRKKERTYFEHGYRGLHCC